MNDFKQRVRWFIRDAVLSPLMLPGVSSLCRRLATKSAVISYHNILSQSFDGSQLIHNVDIAEEAFEKQLRFLKKNYRVQPASNILNCHDSDGVFLSFDDGMLNNYEVVAPLLKKFGMTAVFAICPDLANRKIPFLWRDWLYLGIARCFETGQGLPSDHRRQPSDTSESFFRRLCPQMFNEPDPYQAISTWFPNPQELENGNRMNPSRFHPMSWEHISKLRDAGHVIASHAMTHRPLNNLTDSEIEDELAGSKRELEKNTGQKCALLVYPYGTHPLVGDRAIQLAKECHYELAFMNVRGESNDSFSLPRFGLPNTSRRTRLTASMTGLLAWFKG